MASIPNNEFWKDFFELYRNLPELWKIKSEIYKDKNLKFKSYQKLLTKYKEVEENASIETLKVKLSSIRSCFRRELKKVKRSKKSGAGVDDLYSPTLWYFNELKFLEDHEEQIDGVSTMDDEEDGVENINQNEELELQSSRKKMGKGPQSERNQIFLRALQQFEKNNEKPDEAKTLSASWETMYRKLETRQQIFANRTIMEVLYQGALGKLDENSCKAFDKPVLRNERLRSSTPYSRCTESPLFERHFSTFVRKTESPSTEAYSSETSHENEFSSYHPNPIKMSKYAPGHFSVSQQPNYNLTPIKYAHQFRPSSTNQQQFRTVSQQQHSVSQQQHPVSQQQQPINQQQVPVNQQERTYFSLQELLEDTEYS